MEKELKLNSVQNDYWNWAMRNFAIYKIGMADGFFIDKEEFPQFYKETMAHFEGLFRSKLEEK